MRRLTWFNSTSLTLGFAFLYLPMIILIIFSFNESKLVTVWAGFSTKWYGELLKNEAFLAFVPYAARVPYEVWVVPRRHRADFGEASRDERAGLAAALQDVLRRIHLRLGDPAYHLTIQVPLRYRSTAPHLHWLVRILPKPIGGGGFEVATGIPILTTMPEEYAATLRE